MAFLFFNSSIADFACPTPGNKILSAISNFSGEDETKYFIHVELSANFIVKMDGRSGISLITKP